MQMRPNYLPLCHCEVYLLSVRVHLCKMCFTCVFSTIITENICPPHPYPCLCQQKQSSTVAINSLTCESSFSCCPLCVLKADRVVNSPLPHCICSLEVVYRCMWTNLHALRRRGVTNEAPFLCLARYVLCSDAAAVDAQLASPLPVFQWQNLHIPIRRRLLTWL